MTQRLVVIAALVAVMVGAFMGLSHLQANLVQALPTLRQQAADQAAMNRRGVHVASRGCADTGDCEDY